MKNLKDLTEDQLHEMHFETMLEMCYATSQIKHLQIHVDDAVEVLDAVDEELELRENGPKLKPVSN